MLFALFNAIGGFIFAFTQGSTFAGACVAYLPVFLIILGTFGIIVKKATTQRMKSTK